MFRNFHLLVPQLNPVNPAVHEHVYEHVFLETTQKPLFKHGFDEQGFETFFKRFITLKTQLFF